MTGMGVDPKMTGVTTYIWRWKVLIDMTMKGESIGTTRWGQCKFGSRCRWLHEISQEEKKEGMKKNGVKK